MTRDCKSKVRCESNGCSSFHHQLLHSDPMSLSAATSVLDKERIMPLVRVRFRSMNEKVREGNVLIDSSAGTTVIRENFAKALGLGAIEIAVVGGERITLNDSRRVKFWISPLNGKESYPVKAHELDHTIINVPSLDRDWLKSFDHLSDIEFPPPLIHGVQPSPCRTRSSTRSTLPARCQESKTRMACHWTRQCQRLDRKQLELCQKDRHREIL